MTLRGRFEGAYALTRTHSSRDVLSRSYRLPRASRNPAPALGQTVLVRA
jgi:hypothetical protein